MKGIKKVLNEEFLDSRRFCDYCQKPRTFKYDRSVFHSACVSCGGRIARRVTQEDLDKEKEEKERNKKKEKEVRDNIKHRNQRLWKQKKKR